MKFLLPLLLTCALAAAAGAQTGSPPRATIVAMAQHLVQEQYMHGRLGHYHIEFDISYLHPQPEPNYWAVVGGFISHQSTKNTYVAAVRLICQDHDQVACWELDKLAINRRIIVDRGKAEFRSISPRCASPAEFEKPPSLHDGGHLCLALRR